MSEEAPLNLEAATASKVLQADLRNSVAAVAAGQRIPKADRDRLETSVLTSASPETIAQLSKERQANLLKIWANGRRRLTPAELKEIEHLLPRVSPPPAPPAPPIAPPAAPVDPPPTVAAPSSEPSPEPALIVTASPAIKLSRLGYQHDLAHYEPIFNASNRTLKGWLAIGRASTPPDLPPYDEPAKMKDWYARNKKNRVPDHLVHLAAEASRLTATSRPLAALLTAESVPAPSMVTESANSPSAACGHVTTTLQCVAPAQSSTRGYSATLERLRQAEATAGERYTRLILDPQKQDEAEQARRSWQLLTKELRAYEKDAEEVLQKSGQSWVAAEVVAVIHDLHIPLRDGMLSLYDRIESQLDGLPRGERKRLYRAEVCRLYAALVTNRFTALPPDFLSSPDAVLA